MKAILVGALIIFGTMTAARAQSFELTRAAAPVSIDGRIGEAEWKDAASFDLTNGGRVFFKTDGNYVYVGVRGTQPGWTHLYVSEAGDRPIQVLHASAALGKVVYKRDKANRWQPLNEFSWELRDRTFSDEVRQKQSDYVAKNFWVANNNNMGNRAEVEFQIKLQKPNTKKFRLAVVYAVRTNDYHFFPAGLKDDTLRAELVAGNRVENVTFAPSRWAEVRLESRRSKTR